MASLYLVIILYTLLQSGLVSTFSGKPCKYINIHFYFQVEIVIIVEYCVFKSLYVPYTCNSDSLFTTVNNVILIKLKCKMPHMKMTVFERIVSLLLVK